MTIELPPRRGRYGIDAPYVPAIFLAVAAVLVVVGVVLLATGWPSGIGSLVIALYFAVSAASYLYTTRSGKFAVWERVLRQSGVGGRQRVLDMGCGRGAVLLMAAGLLPEGRAIGLDLWKSSDQSGNRAQTTLDNAAAEGVRDRVEVQTGDMRSMPFTADAFDTVVSSVAIHNIQSAEGRAQAIDEAVRVLKPGGRLLIADIRAVGEYADRLRSRGMEDVEVRGLGWRFWYGSPWVAASLVSARKPAA